MAGVLIENLLYICVVCTIIHIICFSLSYILAQVTLLENICSVAVFSDVLLYCCFLRCTSWNFDRRMALNILQPLMTMQNSCFAFRQAVHFLRPVIRRLPSSAVSTSSFICSQHTDARSAESLYHCRPTILCSYCTNGRGVWYKLLITV